MLAQRIAACSAVLVLTCTSALQASDTTFVSQGARVRVKFEQEGLLVRRSGAVSERSQTERLTGTATSLGPDTLVFVPQGKEEAILIPLAKIEQIEVSEGRTSNLGKGAWIGAAAGVVSGLVVGSVAGPYECCTTAAVAAGLAGVFGAGGALVGMGVGAATSGERWVEAEIPAPPPVALGVGTDGSVRLAFSLRL
jgi:hypothetical protein